MLIWYDEVRFLFVWFDLGEYYLGMGCCLLLYSAECLSILEYTDGDASGPHPDGF